MAAVQLRVYRFGPEARFEGWIVGALERLDATQALRVLDALFVMTDADSGEVSVFDARGRDLRNLTVELLDFRLDPAARERATEDALAEGSGGVPSETLREMAGALEPGGALVAVLAEQGDAHALDEGAARAGGASLLTSDVDATRLADIPGDLRAAAARR